MEKSLGKPLDRILFFSVPFSIYINAMFGWEKKVRGKKVKGKNIEGKKVNRKWDDF